MRKYLFPALGALLLLASCGKTDRTVLVYTDSPAAVLLLNRFNNAQSAYTAEIRFTRAPGKEEGLTEGDVIVAADIQAPRYFRVLAGLDRFRGKAFAKGIYPEALLACTDGEVLKQIPLSLDLPLILTPAGDAPAAFDREELWANSLEFDKSVDGGLRRVGFSPLWSEEFLIGFFQEGSPSFASLLENPAGGYARKIDELRDWLTAGDKDLAGLKAFDEKYRYVPDYRLLLDGHIGYAALSLSEYMLLPDEVTRRLDFSLYKEKGRVLPRKLLAAGIFAGAPHPEGAEALMNWLLEERTWREYYEEILQNRDKLFGLGGISASYGINERVLAEAYPVLKGRLPFPGELARIPERIPQSAAVEREVLIPHVRKVLEGTAAPSSLTEEYRKWQLLNPSIFTE